MAALYDVTAKDFTLERRPAALGSRGAGRQAEMRRARKRRGGGLRSKVLLVCLLVGGAMAALPHPTAHASGATYFQDGFESGDLSYWPIAHSTGGTSAVESQVVHSGAYAGVLVDPAGPNHFCSIGVDLPGGTETATYSRFYFQLSDGTVTQTLASANDVNDKEVWLVQYDAIDQQLDTYFWNGARTEFQAFSTSISIQPHVWYAVEVQLTEATQGVGNVWLDGSLIASLNGVDLSDSTPYDTFYLWNDAAGTTTYYDDVVVSDHYNGPLTGDSNVTLAPSTLNFNSQAVGTSSASEAATLTNTGGSPVTISGITIAGSAASDFAEANTCGTSLAANSSCTIDVTFSPGVSGALTATLAVTDGDPGSPQGVALSGTGTSASPPLGVYFSDGFESGSLAQWSPPSGTGTASVESVTTNSGVYAAQLVNQSGQFVSLGQQVQGGPQLLTYTRFYVNIANAGATGVLAQGVTSTNQVLWVVVYDASRQGLDVYVWNGSRTRFDLYTNTDVIAANTWYAIELEDNEAVAGHAELWLNGVSLAAVNADLSATAGFAALDIENENTGTIYYDDIQVANAYNGLVSAAPTPGALLSPSSLTFSSQTVGTTSAAQSVTLTNNGAASLSISSIDLGGTSPGDFALTTTCGATLAASVSCPISVTFTPTAVGGRSATVVVTDSAASGSQQATLTGTGASASNQPPGTYLSDDFESGSLSNWSSPIGTGQASIVTDPVHSGSHSLQLATAAGSGQYVTISQNLSGGAESLTYTNFSVYIADPSVTTTLATGENLQGATMWAIVYDATRHGLDVYLFNDAGGRIDLYTAVNVITASDWYTLELEDNEATAGFGELWLNDVSVADGSGDLSTANAYGRLFLWNDAPNMAIYYDDVMVSGTFS